jgi:phenylalanine-4-hydroxylase
MITNDDNEVVFFATSEKTALAHREKELVGHGTATHSNGFLSPLGKLKKINLAIEDMGPRDLQAYNFYDNERIEFTYESGITVEGLNITGLRNLNGKLMLIQFTDCTVTYRDEVLFSPEDGILHLAVGKEIVSAYAGPADPYSFDLIYHESDTKTAQPDYSDRDLKIHRLYQNVRELRDQNNIDPEEITELKSLIQERYSEQWLLLEEISELVD